MYEINLGLEEGRLTNLVLGHEERVQPVTDVRHAPVLETLTAKFLLYRSWTNTYNKSSGDTGVEIRVKFQG